jgi:hypothetical protein
MIGWFCAGSSFTAAARAVLEVEHESSTSRAINTSGMGRIGSTEVLVSAPPQPPVAELGDSTWVFSDNLVRTNAIIVTGQVAVGTASTEKGDLIICSTRTSNDKSTSSSTNKEGAVEILRAEAGSDGFWLSFDASFGGLSSGAGLRIPRGDAVGHPTLLYIDLERDGGGADTLRDSLIKIKDNLSIAASGIGKFLASIVYYL